MAGLLMYFFQLTIALFLRKHTCITLSDAWRKWRMYKLFYSLLFNSISEENLSRHCPYVRFPEIRHSKWKCSVGWRTPVPEKVEDSKIILHSRAICGEPLGLTYLILCFVDRASRCNRVKKNQIDAQHILSIFRQSLHVSGVSRFINCCPGWNGTQSNRKVHSTYLLHGAGSFLRSYLVCS